VAWSLLQWFLPLLAVLAMCAIGLVFGSAADWAVVGTTITSALLLIVPYGPWHERRKSLSWEFTRPVSRQAFFRQIAAALAWDALAWLAVGSATSAGVMAVVAELADPRGVTAKFLVGYFAILWSTAVFIHGLALATMRWRIWLLVVALGSMAWVFGVFYLIALFMIDQRGPRFEPIVHPVVLFAGVTTVTGLLLTLYSRWRWPRSDLA
jgi:hypothetical protein